MRLIRINKDRRGCICILKGRGFNEITIFETKQDKARGGCIHKVNDEIFCVVSGIVTLVYGKKKKTFSKGCVMIKKNTPHYYKSLTDSVVLEFGATAKEKKVKYELYRRKVNAINDTSN